MATGFELPLVPMQIPQMPVVITPADLQPLFDKLHQAGIEGRGEARDIMNQQIVGTSGAEAQRAKNEASTATSQQDIIEQQGVQPKTSFISKIFGGGGAKTPAPAPAPSGQSGLQHLSTEELMKIAGGAGYTF